MRIYGMCISFWIYSWCHGGAGDGLGESWQGNSTSLGPGDVLGEFQLNYRIQALGLSDRFQSTRNTRQALSPLGQQSAMAWEGGRERHSRDSAGFVSTSEEPCVRISGYCLGKVRSVVA